MSRLRVTSAAALGVLRGAPAAAQPSDPADPTHHSVRITEDRLTPRVVRMRSGDAIAGGDYTRKRARRSSTARRLGEYAYRVELRGLHEETIPARPLKGRIRVAE